MNAVGPCQCAMLSTGPMSDLKTMSIKKRSPRIPSQGTPASPCHSAPGTRPRAHTEGRSAGCPLPSQLVTPRLDRRKSRRKAGQSKAYDEPAGHEIPGGNPIVVSAGIRKEREKPGSRVFTRRGNPCIVLTEVNGKPAGVFWFSTRQWGPLQPLNNFSGTRNPESGCQTPSS